MCHYGGRNSQGLPERFKAIQGRTQDGAAWLAQLHDAYQIARRKRNVNDSRINIVDVYLEMVLCARVALCQRAEQAHLHRLQPAPVHLRFL